MCDKVMLMNEIERAWVAGLLEGEGSFMWRKSPSNSPRVSCGMTDRDVVERLARHTGGYCLRQNTKAKEYYKDVWVWGLNGKPAILLMKEIRPLMGDRRGSAIDNVIAKYDEHQKNRYIKSITASERLETVALDFIESNDSLRVVAKRHGISHITVKNYVYRYRQLQSRRPDFGVSGSDC